MGADKYVELWQTNISLIKEKLIVATEKQFIQLNPDDFDKVGNRKKYSFNLEYIDGKVINNINGSAVARDLAKVLGSSTEIKSILAKGYFKINMDQKFRLCVYGKQ